MPTTDGSRPSTPFPLPSETHFYPKYLFRLKIFLSYHEAEHTQFGVLRVINEDRVAPKTGFGTHAHREFEIFSYVVDGELEQ
jgi:redox-sensitive bicupin YhaK (pirin superfamily)